MRLTVLFVSALLVIGCSKSETPTAGQAAAGPGAATAATAGAPGTPAAPEMPPGHPPTGQADAPGLTGSILETMDSGGYTYLKVKTAEGEVWAAVNAAKVAKGQTVTVASPMPMDGFESKTLNRKFDRIFFGTLAGQVATGAPAAGAAAPAAPAGMGAPAQIAPAAMAAQHAQAAAGPADVGPIKVAKAEGPDGRTIAELFAQRSALKGKPVAVRGKVVKVNEGIMGKNWLHLRDGSGTAAGKDHDLTVTTQASVAKGDVVVVRGTVGVDRDFGSGYTYSLLVEDAKVTK